MRRFRVATTGVQFDLPEFWHEVTLAQYLRIVAVTDTKTLRPYLEILVADTEQLLACDAGVLTELYKKVEFLKTSADLLSWRVPKTIGGITPPSDINTCTINQYWSVEDWMVDAVEEGEPDTMFSWFVPLLAIYLSPILTGKPYSGKDLAESVLAQIEALPASEAVPLAAFFAQFHEARAFWQSRFDKPVPRSQDEEMAVDMVPEIKNPALMEFARVAQIAERCRINKDEVYTMAFIEAQHWLWLIHTEGRYAHAVRENQKRSNQQPQ